MITLYHSAPSRSMVARWMLEEVGEPYELHVLNLQKGEQKRPEYLAVNPMGKVPALVHDDVVVTEVAAICCYLADAFPKAGLTVPIDDRKRGTYLRWLFFGPGCLEAAIMDRMLKREAGNPGSLGYGDFETTMNVVAKAVSANPYIVGDRFTAADVVVGSSILWGMDLVKVVPERREFRAYVQRLTQRPASQRAFAKDQALAKQLAGG
jgi:glutathione S-transferase